MSVQTSGRIKAIRICVDLISDGFYRKLKKMILICCVAPMPFSRWSDILAALLRARPQLDTDHVHNIWWLCKFVLCTAIMCANGAGAWMCLVLFGIVTI